VPRAHTSQGGPYCGLDLHPVGITSGATNAGVPQEFSLYGCSPPTLTRGEEGKKKGRIIGSSDQLVQCTAVLKPFTRINETLLLPRDPYIPSGSAINL
jgi:hypothetical protein